MVRVEATVEGMSKGEIKRERRRILERNEFSVDDNDAREYRLCSAVLRGWLGQGGEGLKM